MMLRFTGCLVAVAMAMLLAGCHPAALAGNTDGGARAATPVHAAPVRLFAPQSGERYSASLAASRQITLSFRVGGFVESVAAGEGGAGKRLEAGDLIQKGTALAVLRPRDYEIQIQQAKGQVEAAHRNVEIAKALVTEAEAALSKSDSTWKRASALYDTRALTAPDWEGARAQRDIAQAQLLSARSQVQAAMGQENSAAAALSTAELAKADSIMIAPFTGRLLQRQVEVGSLVAPGQPAFTLADTAVVKAVFGAPDSSVIGLKRSGRIPVSIESVPGPLSGTIVSIAAAADPATRLFNIEAELPNAKGTLRPGMIATVYLRSSGAAQPVAVVPLSAIVRAKGEAGGFSLMVVRENKARSQGVTLGATFGDQIAVSGVQPGELVISSGASLLAEGERVEVIQ